MSPKLLLTSLICFLAVTSKAQSDTIVLRDVPLDNNAPAGANELFIPASGVRIAGYFYRAAGAQKHPTLLLLHGFPGNERNLDLAQIVRARGWNVLYFNYRGSWASEGKFSFANCVEDVGSVISFCNKNQQSLKIDTTNIVLFGHSMGGWVCIKSLAEYPQIKKGFALSTWDIPAEFKNIKSESQLSSFVNDPRNGLKYFVLNVKAEDLFRPVMQHTAFYDLTNEAASLAHKSLVMLDEHHRNEQIAEAIKKRNTTYFHYDVWNTDHPFTNKRVSLAKELLKFLNDK
jgi:pimeloyl-ACP methyl ester carboxylesterase